MKLRISFTGVRPSSIGNCYDFKHKRRIKLRKYIKQQIIKLTEDNPDEEEFVFYSGMALGLDQDAFDACVEIRNSRPDLNIKLIAAVPFRNQYKKWVSEKDKARYFNYLNQADEVIYVDELENTKYYSEPSDKKEDISTKLKIRNLYMVDNSDILYGYPSAYKKRSGTLHCIKYAKKQNKKIVVTYLEFNS